MVGSTVTCAQPTGFYPNGLLPNESGSATRVLDPQIWSIAEERTAELIDFIQPNRPSEERRNAIACYVQRLISKCFSCQVFTFGSVPLKTYLPDGDIDVTAFSNNQNLKETWANEVRDILQSEEKSEEAEFRVKEVQYIQAEVKLIKCLVENIVVDISFNQLGGLCTLCFLEEVDSMISQNHLLKRSIILIKAWCYYESRILGAHHGLISTYALEILVLYIFHVFNNSFAGPLEVLYRFMEFFSKFDWDNYCISLWGPVPMSSLPHMIAEPPRKDQEELLLSQVFLRACNSVFTVLPGGLENNDLPFVSKFFNVIDPLRTNNNLGRSVSKGNFFRIRSAFAFGAQRLARLINCPKENIVSEVNQFFFNTLDRHGKGDRPDAPGPDPYFPQAVIPTEAFGDFRNPTKKNEKDNLNSDSHESDQTRQSPSISNGHVDARVDRERNNRSNFLRNEKPRARYQLARTNSSPELSKRAPGQIKKESKLDDCREEQTSFETLQMHQQEQDLVNMMASCRMQSFNGSVQMPPNLMPPSILAYSQRNGIISTSNSSFEPHWGSSMQYSHNLPVSQYISSLGPISNHGEEIEAIEDPKNVYGNDTNNALGSGQDDINSTRVHFSRKENRKWTGDSSDVNSQHPNMAQNFIKSRNSSRPKIPSDISSDGSLLKSSKSTRRWKKPIPSTEHSVSDKYEPQYEFNDDNSDWIPLTTADSETAESVVPSSESTVASSVTQAHQIHSYEPLQMNNGPVPSLAPNGSIPFDSRTFDNNGALPFTIYQMAPPFFVTMLPFFGNNTANSDSDNDKEFNNVHNSQYGQQLNLTESVDLPESSGEHKADILNGDYRSHFQNLIHGRRCQYPLDEGTMLYQSPGAVAATAYHFPGDGPTRPLSANANLFNQLMGYGGGVTPLLPLHQHQHQHQHQQYSDDIPRYRAGTGTYLPNPRISRDRQSSNLRNHRGNYSNDRKDHHADRDGNWNVNKQRFVARNQGCNQQFGRLNARVDRPTQNKRRFDRAAWEPETSHPNHHGHDGQFAPSKLMHQSATNLANGMHPLPVMNPNGVSPAGSFVMLYPYDKNPDFSSNGDNLLEIGPSGPIQYDENSSPRLSSEQQNLLLNSTRSSPDPPGSPIHRRRV